MIGDIKLTVDGAIDREALQRARNAQRRGLLELPSDPEGLSCLEFEREMRRLLVETFCCQVYTPDIIERMSVAVLEMAVRELDTLDCAPSISVSHTTGAKPMTDSPNQAPRIQPSVGRVVLFHLGEHSADLNFAKAGNNTYAAIVAYVHSARLVNLTVFDANGVPWSKTSVPLVQNEDVPAGFWCEWMGYQKGQAAKNESAENATRDIVFAIGRRLEDALAKDPNAFSREQLYTIFGLKPVPPVKADHVESDLDAVRRMASAGEPLIDIHKDRSASTHPAMVATQSLDNDGAPYPTGSVGAGSKLAEGDIGSRQD